MTVKFKSRIGKRRGDTMTFTTVLGLIVCPVQDLSPGHSCRNPACYPCNVMIFLCQASIFNWQHAYSMQAVHRQHACCHLVVIEDMHAAVSFGRTACWQHMYSVWASCTSNDNKEILPMSWVAWVDFFFVNEKNNVGLVKLDLHWVKLSKDTILVTVPWVVTANFMPVQLTNI